MGRYQNGKRKAKAFPNKSLAEHFRHIKYAQLNSDVFTGVVDFDWHQLAEECRRVSPIIFDRRGVYSIIMKRASFNALHCVPFKTRDLTTVSPCNTIGS